MHYWRTIARAVVACAALCGCSREDIVIEGDDLTQQALDAAASSGYKPAWFGHETLRIYTWEDFFAPNVIASFEKALGVTVELETYDSNEEMFARLEKGGTDYDIITPSSYIIPVMAAANMIHKLNHRHLPNVRKNFSTQLKPLLVDPHLTYNIPYTMNYTGIHYNASKLPPDADPESLAILAHPKLKGRTAIFNDMRELIGAGLLHLGYSVNSTNPDEISAATELVIRWKRNAGRADDAFYADAIRSGTADVAMCYSYLALQSICQGGNEGFKLPRGDFSLSVDEFVIAAHARHRALAYAFINYIYDTQVARSSMESLYCVIPVHPAFEMLNPKMKEMLLPSLDKIAHGQVIMNFTNRPKVAQLYEDAWARIQAAGNAD